MKPESQNFLAKNFNKEVLEWWDEAISGRQTHLVWPNIESRLKHNWTRTDFFLTQYWTGHGDYRAKLASFRLVGDDRCDECGAEDTPSHAVFECPSVQDDVQMFFQPQHSPSGG